jgi:hypothetical protein
MPLTPLKESPLSLIILSAVILSLLLGSIAGHIEITYLDHYSYFYDAVSYSFYNARLYLRIPEEGRLSLAIQEWLNNYRHPVRTVPLLLFAPNLLASRLGHLATAVPMLFIFLLLLGYTIVRRTGSMVYAAGCMFLFVGIPGMFNPTQGVGAYWLDLPAAFLVGASALCIVNYPGTHDLRWLIGFAVLASLAALSRYVAGIYAFIICAPVLAYYLIERWRQEGEIVKTILMPIGVICLVIGILSGYFLFAHLENNIQFYSIYGYALGQSVKSSAVSVAHSLMSFVSLPGAITLVTIVLLYLLLLWKNLNKKKWANLVVLSWFALSVIVYLVLVLRQVGHPQAHLYALPLLFLLAVSPMPVLFNEQRTSQRRFTILGSVVTIMALLLGTKGIVSNYDLALHPLPEAREQKNLDNTLAQGLSLHGSRKVWNTYFDEYAWIPTMEAFYRLGEFPLPAGQDYFFSIHESVFKGNYPNLTPDEVSKVIYENTCSWVETAVVFDDPSMAEAQFNNEYSRAVARYVAQTVRDDPHWNRIFEIESKRYGKLAAYRNIAKLDDGTYDKLLKGQVLVQP